MRRFFLISVLFFFAVSALFSTEQIPDRLLIGNDTIYLKSFPLDNLRLKNAPFGYGGYSFPHTGCYRGYVATWQIVDTNLTLKEIHKIDSVGTQLNIVEYLSNNGYNPKIVNGYVVADWYSDTLISYNFFSSEFAYKFDRFYVISKNYFRETDKRIELVFENGKLIRNDIIPLEAYNLGDTLYLDAHYSQDWLVWINHKSIQIEAIIRENNGKKVRLEIVSFGTDKKRIIKKIVKETIKDLDNFWVNPRYCKKWSKFDRKIP